MVHCFRCNVWFWVVFLSKVSSKLTTFHTPYSKYRYLRLPFGIYSAQEVFQKKMDGIFEGIPDVHVMLGDILIASSTKEEHYERLRATLNRPRESGIKFNPRTLQRCSTEVTFFGELLTKDGLNHPWSARSNYSDSSEKYDATEEQEIAGMSTRYVYILSSVFTSSIAKNCHLEGISDEGGRMELVYWTWESIHWNQFSLDIIISDNGPQHNLFVTYAFMKYS